MSDNISEENMFYNELSSLVRRWIDEGDNLSVFGMIGALEAAKQDLMDVLVCHNEEK
jgi:hypothetical protein